MSLGGCMSIQAVAWVLENSEAEKSARLVLLSLANHADKDGTKSFPAVATICQESRLKERAVQYALRELEAGGHIRATGRTQRGTVIYRVLMGGAKYAPQDGEGCKNPQEGGAKTVGGGAKTRGEGVHGDAPEPSIEPSLDPSSNRTPLVAGATVWIGKKEFNREAWMLTGEVLAEFNRQSGRDLRLVTSGGVVSTAASYIYKRIREYPDLTLEDHARIIANTLESRWWSDGQDDGEKPTFNVVYGPRIFEQNISRKPGRRRRRGEEVTVGRTEEQRHQERWKALMELEGAKA